jgi:lantibiotic modifying enzyme
MGGFAHGATGTGWALSHLGRLCRDERYLEMADAAFAFEASLFDEAEGNWTDLRGFEEMKCSAAWCHGSVGIGLAALDLDPRLANESTRITVRRAAEATWRSGIGWSHCLCHGDLGSWELLQRAAAAGLGPRELEDTDRLDAFMLTSIEDNGPVTGMLKDAFIPALLSGMGGILYQLLRMRPGCSLPSVLMMSMN